MRRVTEGAGWWTPIMAADGSAFIGTFSNWETPPQTAVYAPDGRRLRWLSENRLAAGHPYFPYRDGLPRPEFGTLKAEDGQVMHHVLLKPPGFDAKRRYPVIVEVYGGPGRQHVLNGWRSPTERLFLEAGYLYYKLDNRGSANRGLGFEGVIAGKLGTPEVADQIRGLRHLQSLPFVDPDRVGVMGWSYGGFMTLRLLTEPGSGFRAGAAGASPADFRMYDTHYTERFLGKPQDNPAAYDAAAILPRLERLEGRLLLIHGMADDNVFFDNAAGMMQRLQALRTPFDLMLYPDEKHGVQSPSGREHLWRTQKEFFDRALAPREARP
jgi:dipeptidyl-peptidase-4